MKPVLNALTTVSAFPRKGRAYRSFRCEAGELHGAQAPSDTQNRAPARVIVELRDVFDDSQRVVPGNTTTIEPSRTVFVRPAI